MKAVLFPISVLRRTHVEERGADPDSEKEREGTFVRADAPKGSLFSIERDDKFGGPIHYSTYQQMEDDFASGALHPGDLKRGATDAINNLLEPVRKVFSEDPSFQDVEQKAYPKPAPPAKADKVSKKAEKKVSEASRRLTVQAVSLIDNARLFPGQEQGSRRITSRRSREG
jgi:tyrosyl-tRNA synthetase